jgi:predicted ester cyclase
MTYSNTLKRFSVLTLVSLFFLINNPLLFGQNSTDLEQWTKDYVSDLNQSDWKERMAKYGWDGDFETHQEFRKAYVDYRSEVQQVVSDGSNVMAILTVSARWVGNIKGSLISDAKPTGKMVKWKEVWAFNVINGKFGGNWEIINQGQDLMRSAGVNCLPKSMNGED